jgi:hypothetical protein
MKDNKNNDLALSLLKKAIKLKKQSAFTDPNKASDEEALGILISQYSQWCGTGIYNISYNAFEDANFHDFNNKFEDLWESEVN